MAQIENQNILKNQNDGKSIFNWLERALGMTPEEPANKFQAARMTTGGEGSIAYCAGVRAPHPGEMVKPGSTEHINYKPASVSILGENTYYIDIQGREMKGHSASSGRTTRIKFPFPLLTAYGWSEIEQEAMETGAGHFMPKPFFMRTFKEAIKRTMDAHAAKPVQIDNLKATIRQTLDNSSEQIEII